MRAVLWALQKIGQLAAIVGGLCGLALIVSGVPAIAGEHSFRAPLSQESTGWGRYALETGAMLIGAFLVWAVVRAIRDRLFIGYVARLPNHEAGAMIARYLEDDTY